MNIANLKAARVSKGYTQKQVCEILGVNPNTYKNYEQGTREPNNAMLCRLADLFGVTTDYLLGRENDVDPLTGLRFVHGEEAALRAFLRLPYAVREEFLDFLEQYAKEHRATAEELAERDRVRKLQSGAKTNININNGNGNITINNN